MNKRILWIEDDYYAIKGLVRPLEKDGFVVDAATSVIEGYRKASKWKSYDLIVVDIFLPKTDDPRIDPNELKNWREEKYMGVELIKKLKSEMKVNIPILILSVVRNPITKFHLEELGLAGSLTKRGLLPTQVRKEVLKLLGIEDQ